MNPTTRKFHITIDVNFVETIPFFSKTSLQGERANEDQFWHVSTSVPTTFSHDNTSIDGTKFVHKENLEEPSLPMLEVRNSQAREETLHNNSELCVYSRKNFIKLQEKIQLSWKANHRLHLILKVQVYQIQFLLLIMTLIFPLLLEKELEPVLNTLLPTF